MYWKLVSFLFWIVISWWRLEFFEIFWLILFIRVRLLSLVLICMVLLRRKILILVWLNDRVVSWILLLFRIMWIFLRLILIWIVLVFCWSFFFGGIIFILIFELLLVIVFCVLVLLFVLLLVKVMRMKLSSVRRVLCVMMRLMVEMVILMLVLMFL